ncbi:hypothetical protein SAMN05444273_105311 [Litoreibacter ascidiaceicola]|uniref:Uncharacterized protein n=2 Tax=Litoreibacter ascidiaceicola TaxID=1486859 RepID=A0A1M5B4K1_9RHOB|nr:hypothetical protein SAMN05444273_105311 [Litoreibacter ascidiaceicola]
MWKDFVQTSKFGNLAELDVGLRSYFQGLRSPNRLFISWLGRAMENRRVAPPFHGELDPFIEKAFVSTLQDSGHAELLTADEFGDNLSKRSIKGTEIDQTLPIHGVLSTVDQNTILTTHWDSCCSFLCTNDKAISDKALYSFEGFKCTKQTDVYWGLH